MNEQALASSEPALASEPKKRGRPPKEAQAEQPEELFPVKLLRNYRPRGQYEILGHHKDAVQVKDGAGRWHEVEPAHFVHGEVFPSISPGVGFPHKIWANTYISVPRDEARDLIAMKIAERADDV